ncbi:hypothetical protein QYM36_017142 [Artemia franciscana]|uniref:RNA helicase n=2 Tax=Artemia franciscana TaxID=6661 RepID=A0AA88HGS9_ARTSF|nr:hypothetical protein QYM36_017142 [Artemia franciscana]
MILGNSTNKKDAQANACQDFVNYLVRQGKVDPKDLPEGTVAPDAVPVPGSQPSGQPGTDLGLGRPMFREGFGPQQMGEAYQPYGRPVHDVSIYIEQNKKQMAEAEDLDVNAAIHGNWTIENAKSKLHQFMQENRITAEYRYSSVGPDNSRSFIAEMSFYVTKLSRQITAREAGSNKMAASKSCALSLVRQLFHFNVIPAFAGTLKKDRSAENVVTYPVKLKPTVEEALDRCIDALDIQYNQPNSTDGTTNLLQEEVEEINEDIQETKGGVVPWAPPMVNWNPWTGCNIDEGPLATATLEQISDDLYSKQRESLQNDKGLQDMITERNKLPVFSFKSEILSAIHESSVIIVRGATGSGKTTQICQYILDDYVGTNQGAFCNIIVTQPRRISAVSVADRVACERNEDLGVSVGYSVRFESILPRPYGGIMFCTVGVLLRKLESGIRGVSHVIVDEIHERDLNTDFIMVVLRDMVHTYPDMRIILMSATIDTSIFSKYFGNCPVIEIPGRTFPIDTLFLEDCVQLTKFVPLVDPKKKRKDKDDEEGAEVESDANLNLKVNPSYGPEVTKAMSKIPEREVPFDLVERILLHIKERESEGAVLVFLPGWNLISMLMRRLMENPRFNSRDFLILPLHSMLPREDQRRVFQPAPPGCTKVILSTNIAETSVTINDVVYVIDTCRLKMKLYTSHNNMTNYATVWASRSNLEQRKGRAGRVRPGKCYFLCSRSRYEALEPHLTPEIFRTPLHEIALSIKLLRLGKISLFLSKAMEPPPIDAVIEAEATLRDLKCLTRNETLTPLGKILAKLPIEPRLGKMLVLSSLFNAGDAIATIAATDSTSVEVFQTSVDQKRLSGRQRRFAGDKNSDHLALLNAYHSWEEVRETKEYFLEEYCEREMLSNPTLTVISEAKRQLKDLMIQFGFPEISFVPQTYSYFGPDSELDVVTSLIAFGHYPNVCYHKEKRKVLTTESKLALVHKSSVNCSIFELKFPSPFFVFGEKIRTKAVSCKQMTMVAPLQLLLFASKKIEYVDGKVRLDNWINLEMDALVAGKIVALRPRIEKLILLVSQDPEYANALSEQDKHLVKIVKMLCEFDAGRDGLEDTSSATGRRESYRGGMNNRRGVKRSYDDMSMNSPGGYNGQGRGFAPRQRFDRDDFSSQPNRGGGSRFSSSFSGTEMSSWRGGSGFGRGQNSDFTSVGQSYVSNRMNESYNMGNSRGSNMFQSRGPWQGRGSRGSYGGFGLGGQ